MVASRVIASRAPIPLGGCARTLRDPIDIIDSVVAYANGDIRPDLEDRTDDLRLSEDSDQYIVYLNEDPDEPEVVDHSVAASVAKEQIASEVAYAVEMLQAAVAGSRELVKLLAREVAAGKLSDVSAKPTLRLKDADLEFDWVFAGPRHPTGWIRFAGALIAESAVGGRTDIGRCKLDGCRRFFRIVIDGPGKPRREYCCQEHMSEAHKRRSTDRSRRARAKKKAQTNKSRWKRLQ